jgi:hypothetical protein
MCQWKPTTAIQHYLGLVNPFNIRDRKKLGSWSSRLEVRNTARAINQMK